MERKYSCFRSAAKRQDERVVMSFIPRTKKQRIAACAIFAALVLLGAAFYLLASIWNCKFTQTDNSYFRSPFITGKKALVLAAHQDDEVNLAYGVIDALVQAGSDVTIAFSTNGDARRPAATRVAEAIQADALMGVPEENIVLLGYGGHLAPAFFMCGADLVLKSEAGYSQTYGVNGIADYHSLCYGEPAAYTCANFEGDICRLILNLRPDIIFVTDTDDHIDHVSLSQSFDRVMGRLLRDNAGYRPYVFKGFCYEYAWHGNKDFYHHLTLQSAKPTWKETSYHTAYAWSERVRFPLPGEYLGYTLRNSKLRSLLLQYKSQSAVPHENGLLNGDRVFWERRTDGLWATVSTTSGNASLLQDFMIGDTREASLATCWIPDKTDAEPEISFSWPEPQAVVELVFYDAPAPAGDILKVRVTDSEGRVSDYALPDGTGKPCRLRLNGGPVQSLTIRILESQGEPIGFSEIEILPERKLATQWIQLTDTEQNFLYEYAWPANRALELGLYGYPSAPERATAYVTKIGSKEPVAEIRYNGTSFQIPALPRGRYRVTASGGDCTAEMILRVGDSMLKERAIRYIERNANSILPD